MNANDLWGPNRFFDSQGHYQVNCADAECNRRKKTLAFSGVAIAVLETLSSSIS
jgi:hypothetical protein